ncbi:hypothetical protein PMAC_001176 [Pneumocystis sp. 'macacae']|nr:hypothetical protein PMAC_001176 [Pneumocystis sp. 'macacae']
MRLTLCFAFFVCVPSVFGFQKYITLGEDVFYSKNFESCSDHPLIEITSFKAKYYRKIPSIEFDMSARSFIEDNVTTYEKNSVSFLFIIYEKTYINKTYDTCTLGISNLCYLEATPSFSTKGSLLFSSKQINIPEIMFGIPDFEGKAYFRFYSTTTGNEISCLKTTITSKQSFHHRIIIWICLCFFSLSALTSFIAFSSQSGFSYALLTASHSIPGLLTFWNYFQFLTTMAMENVIYPAPLIAWASNFAFSIGLIRFFQQLIYTFNKFTKKYINIGLNRFKREKIDDNNFISLEFYKGVQGQLNYLKITNTNAFITSITCFSAAILGFFTISIIFSFIARIIRRNERFVRKNWINFSLWSILRLLIINVFGLSFISIYQLVLHDTYQPKVLAAFSLLIFVVPVLILSLLYLVRCYFRRLDEEMTAKYWGWLIVEYNPKRQHFYLIFFMYSLSKAHILGIFNFPPKEQTISLCAIELFYLLSIMILRPFESIRAHILELFLGIIRTLCLGTVIVFTFNISGLSRILLGTMIIIMSTIGLLFLFIFTLWNFFAISLLAHHKDHTYYDCSKRTIKKFGKVSGYDQYLYPQKQCCDYSSQSRRFENLTANNIGVFRTLHQVLFPINYNEKFYEESLNIGELAKLAYFNNICVGCIRCQLEDEKLYLMTLGVLAAYRCIGIGQRLLDHILEHAQKLNVKSIYLHVWTENKDAIEWYTKRKFHILDTLPNYYTKIQPGTAHVLSRTL